MKTTVIGWVVLAGLLVWGEARGDSVNKTLFIGIDGLRADALFSADTPNIDRLLNGTFGGGAYHTAYSFQALTAQGSVPYSQYMHPPIATGVPYTTHQENWAAYPAYMTTLETANPSLNTVVLQTWGGLLDKYTADYIGQDLTNSHPDPADTVLSQRAAAMLAGTFASPPGPAYSGSWAAGTQVDAMWVFFDYVDLAGHAYGVGSDYRPDNAFYKGAIHQTDAKVGTILNALEARPNFANENWQIVITTDHGGENNTHVTNTVHTETIPLIVTSKDAQQGQMSGSPTHMDVAPTVVKHMLGEAAVPARYVGKAQGGDVETAPARVTDGLVSYIRFEGDLSDSSGRGNAASVGANSDHAPTVHASGGKFGGYVHISDSGGGAANSSYLTLGKPADLDFGAGQDYTVAMWFRATSDQSGQPVIVGNKAWQAGSQVGTVILADESESYHTGPAMSIGDGLGVERTIKSAPMGVNQWVFVAATVDREGNATMYVGKPDGSMWILTDGISDAQSVTSALPWNIGQDGTGQYAHNLDGDIDDLAIWSRALTIEEIEQMYADGAGVEVDALPEPATLTLLAMAGAGLVMRRRR